MFDLPDAKRVRREDLYDSDSDVGGDNSSGDEALRQKLNAQLGALLDIDFSVTQTAATKAVPAKSAKSSRKKKDAAKDSEDEDEDEEMADFPVTANMAVSQFGEEGQEAEEEKEEEEPLEFAFQLFSGSGPPQKVVLDKADDEVDGVGGKGSGNGGGFVVSKRPKSYYFSSREDSGEAEDRYRSAAVSFEYLLSDARRGNRWGLEKPWRVTSLKVSTTEKVGKDGKAIAVTVVEGDGGEKAGRKRRPGKKRRIVLRTRENIKKEKEVVKKEKEVKAKQQAVDKEQHLLDKKKRLNRAKKLKRRAKAKEQKAGGGGPEDDNGGDSDGSE